MAIISNSWSGKNALITGASSGIGAATARLLASKGFNVMLAARRQDHLHKLVDEIRQNGGQAICYPTDLSVNSERFKLHRRIKAEFGLPDVLINNAGLGWYGYFSEMPWDAAQNLMAVNITAVVHLTRLFLPDMRQFGRGHIINVGSISGSLPEQGIAMYAASKSFLDAFSTSLHREMANSGVHISVVRAGPVRSEFFKVAKNLPGGRPVPAERFAISAEHVASRIVYLLAHPRKVLYVPGVLRIAPWVETLFGWLIDRLGPLLLHRQTIKSNR
jgi:short-subunit dehydrogenase